jgi:hypothetical protein
MWRRGDMDTWTWRHQVEKEKRKTRRFSLHCLSFAHRANGFIFCPFVDEETNESCPFANKLNGLAHLWVSCQAGSRQSGPRPTRSGPVQAKT